MKRKLFAALLLAAAIQTNSNAQINTGTGGAGMVLPNSPTSNTNVGIGTNNPTHKLTVVGRLGISATTPDDAVDVTNSQAIVNPGSSVIWLAYNKAQTLNPMLIQATGNSAPGTSNTTTAGTQGDRFVVYNDGQVKIGNVNMPKGYRLYVEEGILTEKLKVAVKNTANWADYVFAKNYNLMPLNEVEAYVAANKHLPNIPSAQELVNDGMDVASMQAKQMEKIEELTLYMIELKKEVEQLKKDNAVLSANNSFTK